MKFARIAAAALAFSALGAGAAAASEIEAAVEARQGQFKLFSFNIGPLVEMAQGDIEYDADMAATAAENLAKVTTLQQDWLWPEGSDNESIDDTRALPAIWEDLGDFADKHAALGEATAELEMVAGDGLDALRGAIGAVGNACSACHDEYRAEQ